METRPIREGDDDMTTITDDDEREAREWARDVLHDILHKRDTMGAA